MSPSSPAGSSSSSLSYTNVLLALPDGSIPPTHPDRKSHTTSFIGGYPTFPPLPANQSSSIPKDIRCGVCHEPVPLLAQVYCPPEGGENDRTVYVWACPRVKCQKRDGSIRAFRASVRNDEYVKDVEAKHAKAEKEAAAERERARKNPFTLSSETQPNGSALFGTAQPLFGASTTSNPFAPSTAPDITPDVSSLSISDSSSNIESTTLAPPLPAYQPPQYLTTIEEYIPPPPDVEIDSDDSDDDDEPKPDLNDDSWEKMLPKTVDEAFESFVRRLEQAEGGDTQVLRYELGGVPLPYSTLSPICRRLFPGCEKPVGKDEERDIASLYTESIIPPCPRCKSKRTFELQLVPPLITSLRPESLSITGTEPESEKVKTKKSEEERKEELKKLAKGDNGDEVGEMEWGTVLIYGCQRDCVGLGEEWVGVEWETSLEH